MAAGTILAVLCFWANWLAGENMENLEARGDEKAIDRAASRLGEIQRAVSEVVVGQDRLVESLLVAMLCRGHVLLEGVPGLAKTLTVRTLAGVIGGSFQRLQFTPDLLPADVTGTQIFDPKTSQFVPHRGPIFCNLVLADEINRAPAKVQSALLEAMEERQVTIGDTTYKLPEPFVVLATQNPIEQEGTYPLPEAQLDRFLFKVSGRLPGAGGRAQGPRVPPRGVISRAAAFELGRGAPRTRAGRPRGLPR